MANIYTKTKQVMELKVTDNKSIEIKTEDYNHMARKLLELVILAGQAESGHEKAAIYSAVVILEKEMNKNTYDFLDNRIRNKIPPICKNIRIITGFQLFDSTEPDPHLHHLHGKTMTMAEKLEEQLIFFMDEGIVIDH
ncbi:hypothetical protein ACWJJH_01280 [Endozoicomonadaceae bacterium StTr2]